jgi:ComF family protein
MASNTLSSALRPLVDFVYPPRCPLCGEGIAAGPGLCATCWDTLEFPGVPACVACQTPLSAIDAESVCHACVARPPRHSGIVAAVLYNEPARQLVLRFKHGGRIGLARLMGQLMAARLSGAPADAILVPVPLHRSRLWLRGYNQSALLAGAVAHHTGLTVLVDALVRTKATRQLGGLGRAERARMLRDSIRIRAGCKEELEGRDVILIDDVLTSGATTSECVRVLLDSGAASVRIACFARVEVKRRAENETPGTITIPGAA